VSRRKSFQYPPLTTLISAHESACNAGSFASFALLLAPCWFFGFGAAQVLRKQLRGRAVRVLFPGLLVVAYFVFALPRGNLRLAYALALLVIPVGLSTLFELLPPASNGIT
jgi:hypothetical protein